MEAPRIKAIEAANYWIYLASNYDESDLTNLKLQKLLYFAQGEYLAKHGGNPLFGEEIEAWDYGPVVPEVYHIFKSCGRFPITEFDEGVEKPELTKEIEGFLNEIWEKYGEVYSARWLVQETHKSNTPWAHYFKQGENRIIPKNDIFDYFKRKFSVPTPQRK